MEKKVYQNPIKAIRAWCIQCSGGSAREVKRCPTDYCPLFPFKDGTNPFRTKRILTEEQKAQNIERLKQARVSKNLTMEREENT